MKKRQQNTIERRLEILSRKSRRRGLGHLTKAEREEAVKRLRREGNIE